MSCPCWYLVNLPWPAGSVSQTERPHTWVLVSRNQPRELWTPHWARGGRQAGQGRAKQKHNLASPWQTAHLLSASIWGTAHNLSIHILMMANAKEEHTHTHTHICLHRCPCWDIALPHLIADSLTQIFTLTSTIISLHLISRVN